MRKLFSTMLIVSISFSVMAREKEDSKNPYIDYTRGETFIYEQQFYTVLPQLKAKKYFPTSSAIPKESNINLNSSDSVKVVEQKGEFLIFESNLTNTSSLTSSQYTTGEYPVTLNSRTNQLGIILGNLIVQLNQNEDIRKISDKYNLNIKKSFSHLNIFVLQAEQPFDILSIALDMNSESTVKSAEVEVLENYYVPL